MKIMPMSNDPDSVHDHSDAELLRAFAKARDEAAFSEIVRRHVVMVHSTALRLTGQAALAEEIAQNVFV
jgi:DNA-directed RNA polymerase specialized sigma24 family protein